MQERDGGTGVERSTEKDCSRWGEESFDEFQRQRINSLEWKCFARSVRTLLGRLLGGDLLGRLLLGCSLLGLDGGARVECVIGGCESEARGDRILARKITRTGRLCIRSCQSKDAGSAEAPRKRRGNPSAPVAEYCCRERALLDCSGRFGATAPRARTADDAWVREL